MLQRRHRRVHRPDPELPPERPSRRLALEGPPVPRDCCCRAPCAGTSGDRGAASPTGSSCRPATPCRSSTPRWPSSTRASARAARRRRRSPLRLPRRRALGADLGGPADAPPPRRPARATPRWPARPCSSRPTPARRATACRPRPARRSRSSWPARERGQGLRRRGRGRPDPRRHATRRATRPGASACRTSSSSSTGTTSGSTSGPRRRVVHGTPEDWFGAVRLARRRDTGRDVVGPGDPRRARGGPRRQPDRRPSVAWFKTRKGRGYGKDDAETHGTPQAAEHARLLGRPQGVHGPLRRRVRGRRRARAGRPGRARGPGRGTTSGPRCRVLRRGPGAGRLAVATGSLEIAATGARRRSRASTWAARSARRSSPIRGSPTPSAYPAAMWKAPGEKRAQPRRPWAPGAPGSTPSRRHEYGRPLFVVCSADLAESTNIAGLRQGLRRPCRAAAGTSATRTRAARSCRRRSPSSPTRGSWPAWRRSTSPRTRSPAFNGFWGACSTYGSFSYLKYGPMRLFSQLAQDSELKLGQGALGRRPLRPGDGRGFADPLRDLRDRRHAALPEGHVDRPAPVGVQRGAGHAGGRARDRRPDRGPPPHPAAGRDPGPRGARDAVALRGGPRRVRDARLSARPAADGHGLRPRAR